MNSPRRDLCDGCDRVKPGVMATDDGRALMCPTCLPMANHSVDDWLFGDDFAAEFIARTAWPLDSQIKEWSGRLVTDPDLREKEYERAHDRLCAAFRSLDTSEPEAVGETETGGPHDDSCESEFLTGPMAYTACACPIRAKAGL